MAGWSHWKCPKWHPLETPSPNLEKIRRNSGRCTRCKEVHLTFQKTCASLLGSSVTGMSFQSLFIRLVFSFLGNMSDRRENSSSEDESDVPERSDQYDTESESASDSSEADSATRIALKSVQKYPNEKDIKLSLIHI